ncbi:MAG: hypothetical protein H8D45_19395, partial [Bacteroidetes bacterium]|nr:hypothetical protein [Bacteroidota bacterium]
NNGKCKYVGVCPVYNGKLKEKDKPAFLYRNVFCERGYKGWNACKRYLVAQYNIEPPDYLLPEDKETTEDIVTRISKL